MIRQFLKSYDLFKIGSICKRNISNTPQLFRRQKCGQSEGPFKNKIALVTGGATDIGWETTKVLLYNGVKAVTIADKDEAKAESVLKNIAQQYGNNKAIFIDCDVSKSELVDWAYKNTLRTYGHVDIVVNCANVINDKKWELELASNINGFLVSNMLALQYMNCNCKGRGGYVVNIFSHLAIDPLCGLPIYSMTQAAILNLTRTLGDGCQLDRTGVKVMGVMAGFTETCAMQTAPSNCINNKFEAELCEELQGKVMQSPTRVACAVKQAVQCGESGAIWAVLNGQEPFMIDIPCVEGMKLVDRCKRKEEICKRDQLCKRVENTCKRTEIEEQLKSVDPPVKRMAEESSNKKLLKALPPTGQLAFADDCPKPKSTTCVTPCPVTCPVTCPASLCLKSPTCPPPCPPPCPLQKCPLTGEMCQPRNPGPSKQCPSACDKKMKMPYEMGSASEVCTVQKPFEVCKFVDPGCPGKPCALPPFCPPAPCPPKPCPPCPPKPKLKCPEKPKCSLKPVCNLIPPCPPKPCPPCPPTPKPKCPEKPKCLMKPVCNLIPPCPPKPCPPCPPTPKPKCPEKPKCSMKPACNLIPPCPSKPSAQNISCDIEICNPKQSNPCRTLFKTLRKPKPKCGRKPCDTDNGSIIICPVSRK